MKSTTSNSEAITKSLMDILKESGELNLLPEITKELESELEKEESPKEAVVTGAISITGERQKELEKIFSHFLPEPIPFTYKVDSSLLGGFVVQIGDWYLDASIKYELNALKTTLQS